MIESLVQIAETGTNSISEATSDSEIASGASSLSEVNSALENGISCETFNQQAESILADPQVIEGMRDAISEVDKPPTAREVAENPELQQERDEYLKENSPYTDEVNEQIATKEELDYYLENEYSEVEIGDKKILIPEDLDLENMDEDGKTNNKRMESGEPPLDKNGDPYNTHHIGQNAKGPFSLIPQADHRAMSGQLHDTTKASEINRVAFQGEKREIFKGLTETYKERI